MSAGDSEDVGHRHRRRRRRRATAPQGPPPEAPAEPVISASAPEPAAGATSPARPKAEKPRQRDQPRRAPRDGGTDRGLRDLVGAGRSQVGVGGALRARDVNRPTDEDLAAAEAEVEIVRRNWKPRADG